MSNRAPIRRARTYDEIRPLVELCKAGRLFDVQAWIAAGKPVNPPPLPETGRRGKRPLEVALELGFHSLIQVLLEGGAAQDPEGWESPMSCALRMRRFDIVELLVANGFDPKSIDMKEVFETWDPAIMEYFIERGAEMEKGNPLAYALSERIRTAFRILKQYQDRFPSFPEQANIALRHHCKEGNLKWVSLMLWAGADPYKPGAEDYSHDLPDEDESGHSALQLAALYNHFEVFNLKKVRLDPSQPALKESIWLFCRESGFDILTRLFKMGLAPNDQPNGGSSALHYSLCRMSRHFSFYGERQKRNLDTDRAREGIKAIHLLARHGAKWMPPDKGAIGDARRSLLKLIPDYTVEFIWIMSRYNACNIEHCHQLLSTPAMKAHTSARRERIQEILAEWPEEKAIELAEP
jgi:hypothetical protein